MRQQRGKQFSEKHNNNRLHDFDVILFRFNFHLEKVRDIVNTAFTNLFPIDEPRDFISMDVDKCNESKRESMTSDSVEPEDRIMCGISDEIPF